MFNEYLKSIWIILPITMATVLLEALRIRMNPRGDQPALFSAAIGYLIAGLVFGWLAILVFNWLTHRWPSNAAQIYFLLAIGAATALTGLAVMMRFVFKSPAADVVIWTVMNYLWGIGYGWFLPQALLTIKGLT